MAAGKKKDYQFIVVLYRKKQRLVVECEREMFVFNRRLCRRVESRVPFGPHHPECPPDETSSTEVKILTWISTVEA